MVSSTLEQTWDVPGLLATSGSPRTSDRYKFISTQKIVDLLNNYGYEPNEAFYANSRVHDPLYGRHCIRFSKEARTVNNETPEIIVFNSHNGLSSAQITSGIFRLVCSNGMVIATEQFDSYKIPHRGYKASDAYINYAITNTIANLEKGKDIMESWKTKIAPTFSFRKDFYKKAMNIRFPNHLPTELTNFDMPQRRDDAKQDMWTVFNRVQEYIVNGGFTVTHTEGKKPRQSRALTNVKKLQEVNEELWSVTEDFVGANW